MLVVEPLRHLEMQAPQDRSSDRVADSSASSVSAATTCGMIRSTASFLSRWMLRLDSPALSDPEPLEQHLSGLKRHGKKPALVMLENPPTARRSWYVERSTRSSRASMPRRRRFSI